MLVCLKMNTVGQVPPNKTTHNSNNKYNNRPICADQIVHRFSIPNILPSQPIPISTPKFQIIIKNRRIKVIIMWINI